MAMADDNAVKIMESLGLNFNPASMAIKSFEGRIAALNKQLFEMKAAAISGARDINQAFSSQSGGTGGIINPSTVQSMSNANVILNQYGGVLKTVQSESAKATEQQSKYNKELAELIHLRKTQQIDAQTFVREASKFREQDTWDTLKKREQISLVGQLSKAESEHTRVLNEQAKIKNALNKEAPAQKLSELSKMQADAASIQQRVSAKGLSEEYSKQASLLRSQITVLSEKLQAEGKLTAAEIKQTAQLKEQLSILKSQTRASVADIPKKQANIIGNEFSRRAGWFISGTAFYGGINAAKEAVQSIAQVESSINTISRVMQDATFNAKEYRNQLLQIGVDMGRSFDDVQKVATTWATAGYNAKNSIELTKTSLLAMNTAEMDATQATTGLVAIMSQWGLTTKDLLPVLDKINKVADTQVITSGDLINGLAKASATARNFGLDINDTIAYLSVMKDTTGATGKELGNAFKSILSYTQRPKALEVFESLGIEVYADKARTQFKSVSNIFEQIAAKWAGSSAQIQEGFIKAADDAGLLNDELTQAVGMQETWNDVQKRDISQSSGGVYRRTYFQALIQNLGNLQKVYDAIGKSAGYSEMEQAQRMETLQAKYESLKTAATELAVALGDAGLLDILKGLTVGAKDAAQWFTHLDAKIRTLIITSLELLGAVKGVKAVMGLFTTKNLIFGDEALLPGWTKLIPLVIAAAGAIALYSANSRTAALEDLKRVKAQKDEIDEANNLISKYEELKGKTEQTTEVKTQLHDIEKQLAELYPELAEKIDEQNQKYTDQIDKVKELTAEKQKMYEQDLQQTVQSGETKKDEWIKKRDEAKKDYESKQDTIERLLQVQSLANRYKMAKTPKERSAIKAEYEKSLKYNVGDVDFEEIVSTIDNTIKNWISDRDAAYKEYVEFKKLVDDWVQASILLDKLLNPGSTAGPVDILGSAGTMGHVDKSKATGVETPSSTTSDELKQYDLKIDRYMKFNNALQDIENELANYKALQDAAEGKDKIPWIEKEIDALKRKRTALVNINVERREERNELKKKLTDAGFIFDTKGEITNYPAKMKSLTAWVSGLPEEGKDDEETKKLKAYKQKQFEYISGLEESVTTYNNLVHNLITNTDNEVKQTGNDIVQLRKNIDKTIVDAFMDEFDKLKSQYERKQISLSQYTLKLGNMIKVAPDEESRYKLLDEMKDTLKDAFDSVINDFKDELNKLKGQYDRKQISPSTYKLKLGDLLKIAPDEESRNEVSDEIRDVFQKEYETALKDAKNKFDKGLYTRAQYESILKGLEKKYTKTENVAEVEDILDSLKREAFEENLSQLEKQYSKGQISLKQYISAVNELKNSYKGTKDGAQQLTALLDELNGKLSEEPYDKASKALEHWSNMGVYTISRQIEELRKLKSIKTLSAYEQWKIDEELQGKYKDLIQERLDTMKDSIDEQIKAVEKEADDEIKIQQDKIEALDVEKEASDRLEAEREHNKKLADLEKEKQYHSVRTGEEHRKALLDIDEKIAEENREWKKKEYDWDLEKQKSVAEKEIDRIKEDSDKKKAAWDDLWDDMQKTFSDNNLNLITAAMTTSSAVWDEWVKNYFNPMETAIKSGKYNPINPLQTEGTGGAAGAAGVGGTTTATPESYKIAGTSAPMTYAGDISSAQTAEQNQIRSYAETIVKMKDLYRRSSAAQNQQMMDYARTTALEYYDKMSKISPALSAQFKNAGYEEAQRLLGGLSLTELSSNKTSYYGKGNIDLNNRPIIHNPDGSISTVYSMTFDEDGKYVLVPGVRFGLDRKMTAAEAWQWYLKTGEYLGKFNSEEEADKYAEQLHEDQANLYTLPQFHTGAKTLSYGIAEFKPGELIFPPGLSSSLERLISVLSSKPITSIPGNTSRTNQIDKLLNVEKMYLGDELDAEIVSRQLKRAVNLAG